MSIIVRLSANQRALNAYVKDILTEHKHKHKKKAYAYAYAAVVFSSAYCLLMLMFMRMFAWQVMTGLKNEGAKA